MSAPKLGIIGFGEVGAILADALSQAGIDDITAFVRTPRTAPGITTYTPTSSTPRKRASSKRRLWARCQITVLKCRS